ncbi:MAG: dTDP-4-dehydrorhamnose reductase [Pseudomonadales bacterium]|nr:dTDP-4-dehydrorhamnose reductase [Pseudomonadales bacterium]
MTKADGSVPLRTSPLPRILLLGAGGQLGSQLKRSVPAAFTLYALNSTECDITDAGQLSSLITSLRPDVVINAAAYTQVDKAEQEAARCQAVNADGIENLARAVSGATRIIHVSTDFVFDGGKNTPYEPGDPAAPLNVYGHSKRAGEEALLRLRPEHSTIIRTAWLYSLHGQNFVTTMLRLMASKESLHVVADQIGTPTSTASLAAVIWHFVDKPEAGGIFHWTDQGCASWYDFAWAIQREGLRSGRLQNRIPLFPIRTADYPTAARRPAYSVLDCHRTRECLRIRGKHWQEELQQVMGSEPILKIKS